MTEYKLSLHKKFELKKNNNVVHSNQSWSSKAIISADFKISAVDACQKKIYSKITKKIWNNHSF